MPITITALDITENYAALTILTEAELNEMVDSAEDYINEKIRLNLIQFASDVMDPATYVFNDDGVPTFATPLINLVGRLAENETVAGQWTFTDITTFNAAVNGTSVFTSTGQPRCRAYRPTINQTIANATPTALSLGAETYDVGAMHDIATNPNRITIPGGGSGIYNFTSQVTFVANNVGWREVRLYKNGSQVAIVKEFGPHATEQTVLNLTYQDSATVGDYYEIYVYQNSTGNLDIVFDVSNFAAMKVW